MKLVPLPQAKFESLRPVLDASREELNMLERGDTDIGLERIEAGYNGEYMGVFVDDVDNIKHCVVLAMWPGIVTKHFICAVVFIYSAPEVRGRRDAVRALTETIDQFAISHGAGCILGSSWKYRGARPTDRFWTSNGYEIQETTYVKVLEVTDELD